MFWSNLWKNMKEWVTDWYTGDVLKEALTSQAMSHRQPVMPSLLEKHGKSPENYGKQLPERPSSEELVNAFLFSGVDYRGQAQHAFETLGYGAGVSAAVDFAKIFAPPGVSMFLTASVSGNLSAKRAAQKFLLIANQGGPEEFSGQHLPHHQDQEHSTGPVLLACMLGTWTNMKGGLGVTIGTKFDTTNFTNLGIGEIESIGFNIGFTASASGSLDGTWVLVTDPHPSLVEKSRKHLETWLPAHLDSTTSEQDKQFKQDLERSPSTMGKKTGPMLSTTKVNPACYLSWWIHSKEAGAGLDLSANVTGGTRLGSFNGQNVGPGGSLTIAAKLPTIKWTSKTSAYRLNTPCTDPDIIFSQEIKVLYKQVGAQMFGLAMDLELGCAVVKPNPLTGKKTNTVELKDPMSTFVQQNVDASSPLSFGRYVDKKEHGGSGKALVSEGVAPPDLELYKSGNFKATLSSKSLKISFFEDTFKKLEKKCDLVNSMSYEGAMAFWSREHHSFLEGTGLVIGQSLSLPGFVKYWSNGEQSTTLFGWPDPSLHDMGSYVDDQIKEDLPASASALPSPEDWLRNSNTGDTRWNIKAVDKAVSAFAAHLQNKGWQQEPAKALHALEAQARKNCGAMENVSPEGEQRRLLAQKVNLALADAQARATLYAAILKGIEDWIVSKGGEDQAHSNKRYLAVKDLRFRCMHDMERLDGIASALDVIKERLEMLAMELGLARALSVKVEHLRTFLANQGLQGAVKDIVSLQKEQRGQVPGAFLIEANYKLSGAQLGDLKKHQPSVFVTEQDQVDLGNNLAEVMKHLLANHYDDALQYIAIRYRKADTKAANRSFKLGANIGAAQLGFSIDRVRQAATEGSFMVHTVWFGSYQGVNGQGGWPHKAVPMPTLLS